MTLVCHSHQRNVQKGGHLVKKRTRNFGKGRDLPQKGQTTPLQLAGTTVNQMKQVPLGMQLMQIPTQGGCTVTVPYSMNANGEIAFSGMQLGYQGFSGAQVRQGFDATQAKAPQIVKTGYYNM
ncbi:unnamed protein product [Cylindrotheca closterium]|uniref:Uncharacterized protein n=1 Tax=Cylindrotheca closterium TaxID=2856 RepID=A0AAD2CRB2_9STRA|nr:unnamed protein product [Cylindrotheca closterium]